MLPSKGYFKFLNCPFFDSCFCNRPHCHFRHSRKDKYGNEIEISDDMDFENLKNETDDNPFSGCTPEMLEELSKNFVEPGQSSGPITYKPTPIAELKKRHIPVTAAPSASTSQESSRKIDNVRKSKAEYCPGSEQSSHTPPTYKATKISKSPKKSNDDRELILNTSVLEGDKVGSISPKTDNIVEDIDLEQLSKTLDFIDEFLYDSDNKPQNTVISDKSSSGNTDNKRNSGKSPSENILVNLNDDSLNKIEKNKPPAKTNHEHLRVSKSEKKTSSHKENQERHGSKRETSLESKGSKSSEHKKSSLKRSSKHLDPHEDNKLPAKTNKYSDHEHLRVSKSEKKTSSHKENQERHGSKRETSLESKEYKSSEHKKSSLKRSSKHLDPHENNIPPIKTKKYSDHEHLSEATEDISNLNKNKHIKKENDKQGDKSSKKSSSHKHSSRSSSKKDENVKNSSSKSSNKQSEHKTSSASDHKVSQQITHSSKTSTHKSVDSKTEPLSHHEHHKSTKSKSSSSDNFSTSSKHKEKKHKKESHDKRKISETHRKTHKDDKRKDESKNKSRRVEAAIRLDDEDDDDVEFVSELKPVIVLDSEEESTNEEIKKVKNKNKFEREERKSVSPSFDYSPTLPSGDSSSESEDNNEVTVAPSVSTVKIVDDLAKLDNRVMQRMKNRVSLGNTWRPPTKKPVHMMKPAERMAMFRKRLIDIDEQYDPEAPGMKPRRNR